MQLSHIPLVWMVREAQRAGLMFDRAKLRAMRCCPDQDCDKACGSYRGPVPSTRIMPSPTVSEDSGKLAVGSTWALSNESRLMSPPFHTAVCKAIRTGLSHDVLCFGQGATALSVISWNMME